MKAIKKSMIVFLLTLVTFVLFSLSGCGNNYVSEKTILEDLQKNELFSIHSVEIENFEIIKRLSTEEKDSIFINVKGKNSVYSISLNYKMVYLPYNDGWLIETVEQHGDDDEFVNEIIPLSGPTQEDVDYVTSTIDFESYSSYDKKHIKESKWEIIDNKLLEVDNDYGIASYLCKIVYNYTYFEETITFPIIFNFAESSNGARGWLAHKNDTVGIIERQVNLTDEICGDWGFEINYTPPFSARELSYNINLTISSVTTQSSTDGNGVKNLCTIENYVFSDDETYRTSGTMKLFPSFSEDDGKISSLSLDWVDGDGSHPKKCSSLHFSVYFGKINNLVSNYKPSYGLTNYPLVLTKNNNN